MNNFYTRWPEKIEKWHIYTAIFLMFCGAISVLTVAIETIIFIINTIKAL